MALEVAMKVEIEIHCHTDARPPCSRMTPGELIAMASAGGYDFISHRSPRDRHVRACPRGHQTPRQTAQRRDDPFHGPHR